MEIIKSKVYVLTDEQGRIIRCEGGFTTPADLTGWTQIDEGVGDRYNLAQSNYFPDGLYTADGILRYKLQEGMPVERTQAELDADRLPLRMAEARARRDKLLADTDWTQTLDAPVSAESKAALRAYRQELRDLPQNEDWPECIWPELPEIVKAAPAPVDEIGLEKI